MPPPAYTSHVLVSLVVEIGVRAATRSRCVSTGGPGHNLR
jgi:hypothetical protein